MGDVYQLHNQLNHSRPIPKVYGISNYPQQVNYAITSRTPFHHSSSLSSGNHSPPTRTTILAPPSTTTTRSAAVSLRSRSQQPSLQLRPTKNGSSARLISEPVPSYRIVDVAEPYKYQTNSRKVYDMTPHVNGTGVIFTSRPSSGRLYTISPIPPVPFRSRRDHSSRQNYADQPVGLRGRSHTHHGAQIAEPYKQACAQLREQSIREHSAPQDLIELCSSPVRVMSVDKLSSIRQHTPGVYDNSPVPRSFDSANDEGSTRLKIVHDWENGSQVRRENGRMHRSTDNSRRYGVESSDGVTSNRRPREILLEDATRIQPNTSHLFTVNDRKTHNRPVRNESDRTSIRDRRSPSGQGLSATQPYLKRSNTDIAICPTDRSNLHTNLSSSHSTGGLGRFESIEGNTADQSVYRIVNKSSLDHYEYLKPVADDLNTLLAFRGTPTRHALFPPPHIQNHDSSLQYSTSAGNNEDRLYATLPERRPDDRDETRKRNAQLENAISPDADFVITSQTYHQLSPEEVKQDNFVAMSYFASCILLIFTSNEFINTTE
ncbi:hypothetical protein EG68_02958 [Paragonimus skrjabini miyazakii]|uniref:Uncharacterized protein n=1 Tax=Paragonimus skrjabini miyazakii TaxID=59628 RepID=A0A8S9Z1E1_9TREM|nr:hypothetical protein EG68_02958 [Paragonimus skrjabini miyazakii]